MFGDNKKQKRLNSKHKKQPFNHAQKAFIEHLCEDIIKQIQYEINEKQTRFLFFKRNLFLIFGIEGCINWLGPQLFYPNDIGIK